MVVCVSSVNVRQLCECQLGKPCPVCLHCRQSTRAAHNHHHRLSTARQRFLPRYCYGSIGSIQFTVCFFVCLYGYGLLSGRKGWGVKFYMRVRLLSRQVFSALALLPGCMQPLTGCRRRLPARLGGDLELRAVARWGSHSWWWRRCLRPYGEICVLQAC